MHDQHSLLWGKHGPEHTSLDRMPFNFRIRDNKSRNRLKQSHKSQAKRG